jgi:hypothetical protein
LGRRCETGVGEDVGDVYVERWNGIEDSFVHLRFACVTLYGVCATLLIKWACSRVGDQAIKRCGR